MFDDDSELQVVVNDEEQHSVWPVGRDLPLGWRAVGVSGTKDECLGWIDEHWVDLRPLSLRRAMAEDPPPAREPLPPRPEPLVDRLVDAPSWRVEVPGLDGAGLHQAIRDGAVRLRFPHTLGGTTIACTVDGPGDPAPAGAVRVRASTVLDRAPIAIDAEIDLTTMTGTATVSRAGDGHDDG